MAAVKNQINDLADTTTDESIVSKKDLAAKVADHMGISNKVAAQMVSSVFDVITQELTAGKSVSLVGFGVFTVAKRAKRTGRNLHTQEPMEIPESKLPKFRPGKVLKDSVNGTRSKQ